MFLETRLRQLFESFIPKMIMHARHHALQRRFLIWYRNFTKLPVWQISHDVGDQLRPFTEQDLDCYKPLNSWECSACVLICFSSPSSHAGKWWWSHWVAPINPMCLCSISLLPLCNFSYNSRTLFHFYFCSDFWDTLYMLFCSLISIDRALLWRFKRPERASGFI